MALPKAELDDQKIDFVEMDHPLTALGWGPWRTPGPQKPRCGVPLLRRFVHEKTSKKWEPHEGIHVTPWVTSFHTPPGETILDYLPSDHMWSPIQASGFKPLGARWRAGKGAWTAWIVEGESRIAWRAPESWSFTHQTPPWEKVSCPGSQGLALADQRSDPEDPLQIQPYESSLFYPLLMIHRLGFVGGQLFFLSFGGVVVEVPRSTRVDYKIPLQNLQVLIHIFYIFNNFIF